MKKQTKKTEQTDLTGKRYVVKDNNNNWFNLNEHIKIGKNFFDGTFSRNFQQSFIIHLHPGWNATDQRHFLMKGFLHNFI